MLKWDWKWMNFIWIDEVTGDKVTRRQSCHRVIDFVHSVLLLLLLCTTGKLLITVQMAQLIHIEINNCNIPFATVDS